MTDTSAIEDGYELIHPAAYAKQGPPHDVWTRLRREAPLARCESADYEPFWAVTLHDDIREISGKPDLFKSEPGIVMLPRDQVRNNSEGLGAMRTIIEMDPPEHREYRKVASPWFTPRSLKRLEPAIEESARALIDRLAGETGEGECDFATDVAAAHPLRILSMILGLSQDQEPAILRLTNQLFAPDDEELQRKGMDRDEAVKEVGLELYQMFASVIEDRKANPSDDLASVLANGKVNSEPMGLMETFGYFLIAFTAGHDTTKNSLAGGLLALLENPDQLQLLKNNPSLVGSAVEEVVRWSTPVNYMKRTAARDTALRGQKIREGDELLLQYASANRDESMFEAPFEFRVDRDPNPHLGFGIGEHFCLGAHLARRSQGALLREFSRRIESVELIGEPEWIRSSFVVGLKHIPVRYRFSV
ncbi:MAG: cytochrome P450 [bacterium]|nr:cytochrome P450 [bacterium]